MTGSFLDAPVLMQRYFFPRQEPFAGPFWVESQGVRLACYYRQKFPEAKTVIFFHGNGETVADYIDFYGPMMDFLGYNCFLSEYRGYGLSTGEPGLVAMLTDVSAVIKASGQPLDKLVLFGRSVGSIYAIHGASLFPGIPGLIIESGIAEVLPRLLLRVQPEDLGVSLEEMEQEVATYLDAEQKLAGYHGQTLVMHARHDSMVPLVHGQELYDWAPLPKVLKIFDQGDHNSIFPDNAETYVQVLKDFLSGLPG